MKDLKDKLNESLLVEGTQWKSWAPGSELGRGVDSCNCEFRGSKKYGFAVWMIDEETIALAAVDSAEEWAEACLMEVETLEPAFKLKPGEVINDGDCYTMRLW